MDNVLSPDVYDLSGKKLSVPEHDIHEGISQGKIAFAKGRDVPVLNPNGLPGTIPSDQAQVAFQNGFTFDPPSQQLDRIKQQETSGISGAAKAALAGAARGPTLGASDWALTKSGLVSPEELSDLQKYRPGWSLAGEAAGIIADPLGAAGLIGDAGSAVARAVDPKLLDIAGKVASGSPLAAKVLGAGSDIASHALGSAVEGALYSGVGNSVSEAVLGDPDLNAEKVMSNFGYGALFGGALGGALKGLEIGAPPSLNAAKDGLVSLKNTLMGTGEGDAGLLEKVIPPGKFLEAVKNRAINLDTDESIRLVRKVTDDLNTTVKNVQSLLKDVNKDVRPEETKALINSPELSSADIKGAYQNHLDQQNKTIDTMRNEPELYPQNIARKLELERDAYTRGIKEDATNADFLDKMQSAKRGLNKNINFSKIPTAQEADAINLLNSLRRDLKDTLRNPAIFGEAGSRLAAHDDMLSRFYDFVPPSGKTTEFQKDYMKRTGGGPNAKWEFDPTKVERVFKRGSTLTGQNQMERLNNFYEVLHDLPDHVSEVYQNVPNRRFDPEDLKGIINRSEQSTLEGHQKYLSNLNNSKNGFGLGDIAAGTMLAHHPLVSAAIEAYQFAKDPIKKMNQLALVERMAGKVTNAIGKGAMSVFEPLSGIAASKAGVISTLALEDTGEKHEKLSKQIKGMVNDPGQFASKLDDTTKDLANVAPNTAQGLQLTASRAAQFLASKLPGRQTNPFSAPYEPSPFEIAKFNNYREVVEDPLLAFKQMKAGMLSQETLETLNVVYPKLFQEMKASVLKAASQKLATKEAIPYQSKQQISFFLGEPLDQSLKNVAGIQMNFQPPQAQVVQPQRPSKTGMGKITLAERSQNGSHIAPT